MAAEREVDVAAAASVSFFAVLGRGSPGYCNLRYPERADYTLFIFLQSRTLAM
jgi:hypothetical protein